MHIKHELIKYSFFRGTADNLKKTVKSFCNYTALGFPKIRIFFLNSEKTHLPSDYYKEKYFENIDFKTFNTGVSFWGDKSTLP